MASLIQTEFLKLKRSMLLWMIPLSALFTGLLEYSSLLYNKGQHPHYLLNWDWLIFTNFRYVTVLISPVLFTFMMGYLLAREFQDRTASTMFTYSINRISFLLAKYLVMVPIVVSIMLLEFLCTVGAGFLVPHPVLTGGQVWNYVVAFGSLTVMELAFLPLAATVSLLWRSYLPNIILGVFSLIVGVVVSNSPEYSIVVPWSAPIAILSAFIPNSGADATMLVNVVYWKGVLSLGLMFFLPFLFNILYLQRMDIDNS